MGLLKPAANRTAFAKIGIMGFQGSGKTFTASDIARGLATASKSKTIAFFDTEGGSDFEVTRMKKLGFELVNHKGRAFIDLISVIHECEAAKIPVLIIDSITHVWEDLTRSYQTKTNKKSLSMFDWGILKNQWKEFTDLYLNSKLHILMLGRAGYTYDQEKNEDTGKNEIIKTGTKFRAEGQTGYEPDLLIEMEAVQTSDKIINRAWVLKDRSDTLNGKSFDSPSFKTFKTFFDSINIGADHEKLDTKRDSTSAFDNPDWSQVEVQRRKEIALEDLQTMLIKGGLDGTAVETKKKRVEFLEKHFGTASKTAIENTPVTGLETMVKAARLSLGQLAQPEPLGDIPQ